ncbi:MAG: hypothetical protein ABL901_19025 [Hyphomicrobiaceae bacterium]
MMKQSQAFTAGILGLTCLLAGCSSGPDKVLETSSLARKKSRSVEVTQNAPAAKPTLADKCLQRHVDFQAGRNQPATLEQKQAMDAACASAH